MNISRKREIQRTADNLRAICKENGYGIKDIFGLCEKIVPRCRLIRYPLGQNKLLGLAGNYQGEFVIVTNSSEILSREIFTLAHEIGHMQLHLNGQNSLVLDKTISEDQENETEANYFAACFLMPKDAIEKYIENILPSIPSEFSGLDIARLQIEFNVSYEALITRLTALNIIDSKKSDELRAERQEKTATHFLKAVGGNSDLCLPTDVKRLPPDFLNWALKLREIQMISDDTFKKALDFAGIDDDPLNKSNLSNDDETLDLDDVFRGLTDGSIS
jgi:Zn-dependent peptidase ImmA (M78 family)